MPTKLTDAELKVMDVLWEEGELSAVELAKKMNARIGWARNTTYTVAKKLVEKPCSSLLFLHFVNSSLFPQRRTALTS